MGEPAGVSASPSHAVRGRSERAEHPAVRSEIQLLFPIAWKTCPRSDIFPRGSSRPPSLRYRVSFP